MNQKTKGDVPTASASEFCAYRWRRVVAGVAALVVLAGAAACAGGGGSAGSSAAGSSAPALSKAELIRQADAICASGNHTGDQSMNGVDPGDPAAVGAGWDRWIASFDDTLRRVSRLAAPPDDRASWQRFLALTRAQRASFVQAKRAQMSGDTVRINRAIGIEWAAAAKANAVGAAYGLHECVVDADTIAIPKNRKEYLGMINFFCYSTSAAEALLPQPQSPAELLGVA